MKLLQNILVPTDFSVSSERAIEASIQMAKSFQSKITLLHVYSEENFPRDSDKLFKDELQSQLEEQKNKIEKYDIDVAEVILEKGIAFEKIIQVSQERDVNVIVVGSGSKTSDDYFKLGTNVEKLMRKNQIPMWVVKNEEVKPINKIICPVDFSSASIRAFQNAITLAERLKAELHLVHVFEPVMISSVRLSVDIQEENKKLKAKKEQEFHEFVKQFDVSAASLKQSLLMGDPFIEILKVIKNTNSDLLVMGTTGKSVLSRWLMGSVTEKVTRELPCSFITTKAKDITENYLESNLNLIESVLKHARLLFEKGKYDEALDKFIIGLKQYPDNIPLVKGVIESYKALGDDKKVKYYKEYEAEVIRRTWGEEYLKKIIEE